MVNGDVVVEVMTSPAGLAEAMEAAMNLALGLARRGLKPPPGAI
jgi:hypothetical protein